MEHFFWNHRLMRQDGQIVFVEVYYEPFLCGDTVAEMRELAARFAAACDQPILEELPYA